MERREMREQKRGVQAELAEARFQMEQISLHKSALEDEIRALKEKAFAQGRMIDDQACELERARSVEEAHEELKAQYEGQQEKLDLRIAKHNQDFASKGGDANFAKACDFFALAGLDGSEAVAPWLLVLKICGKDCSTREEQPIRSQRSA